MTITGSVLILGATSDIARAVARAYAARGCHLLLAARNPDALAETVADLRTRYIAQVDVLALDILDTAAHTRFIDSLPALPQTVVCAVGMLPDQRATQSDPALAETTIRTNYLAPALLLDQLAGRMEVRGNGTIIGISSVAGDRGRASNYCYGAAKAGFTAYLSGLRNRLARKGVTVITVKPGFVRTRMTEGMALPRLLTASAHEVSQALIKAHARGRPIVYVRPVWRLIMGVIAHLPESIFKRLSL